MVEAMFHSLWVIVFIVPFLLYCGSKVRQFDDYNDLLYRKHDEENN